jgi:hypothetical protein
MFTIRLSRAVVGTLLLAASALSAQAQARPSDPFWHPVTHINSRVEKPCGPIVKTMPYGPRGVGVVVGDHGACPKQASAPTYWVGPRGTVPVRR